MYNLLNPLIHIGRFYTIASTGLNEPALRTGCDIQILEVRGKYLIIVTRCGHRFAFNRDAAEMIFVDPSKGGCRCME